MRMVMFPSLTSYPKSPRLAFFDVQILNLLEFKHWSNKIVEVNLTLRQI